MRTYRANGGSISTYYNDCRKERHQKETEKLSVKLHKNTVKKAAKEYFGSFDPDEMVEMPTLVKPEFKWLRELSRYSA